MCEEQCASDCGSAMSDNALIDAGAILALLDRTDHWHSVCARTFEQLRLPLVSSQAVLTELFHLVGESRHEMETAWRFRRSGAIFVATSEHSELPQVHALMSRYADRPMDFADATLVHLARREAQSTIFTVDHADFNIYRIDGRRRFRVVPSDSPIGRSGSSARGSIATNTDAHRFRNKVVIRVHPWPKRNIPILPGPIATPPAPPPPRQPHLSA